MSRNWVGSQVELALLYLSIVARPVEEIQGMSRFSWFKLFEEGLIATLGPEERLIL